MPPTRGRGGAIERSPLAYIAETVLPEAYQVIPPEGGARPAAGEKAHRSDLEINHPKIQCEKAHADLIRTGKVNRSNHTEV